MESLVAQKLATLAYELQTTAIRIEAQHEAPLETALELYDITRRIREIASDVEAYRKKE